MSTQQPLSSLKLCKTLKRQHDTDKVKAVKKFRHIAHPESPIVQLYDASDEDDEEDDDTKSKASADLLDDSFSDLQDNDNSDEEDGELRHPSLSSPEERSLDAQVEDNEDFYGAFFIAEHAPLIFNQEQPDMILLDPTVDQPSRQRNMFAAQNKERNIFSRNICSFKNGTPLLKHCAPWGEFSVLCEDSFILEKKCFGADGEVTSVVVKTRSAPKREYMLCPAFFAGWTDKATLEQYYSY